MLYLTYVECLISGCSLTARIDIGMASLAQLSFFGCPSRSNEMFLLLHSNTASKCIHGYRQEDGNLWICSWLINTSSQVTFFILASLIWFRISKSSGRAVLDLPRLLQQASVTSPHQLLTALPVPEHVTCHVSRSRVCRVWLPEEELCPARAGAHLAESVDRSVFQIVKGLQVFFVFRTNDDVVQRSHQCCRLCKSSTNIRAFDGCE